MKRRNFLAAVAASIVVPVNIDSWNKFLESDKFIEMIYDNITQEWYKMYRIDLTNKNSETIGNVVFFSRKLTKNSVICGIKHPEYLHLVTMPLENGKVFTVEDKKCLLKDLIKMNPNHKILMAEIRISNATNIFGWAE